MFTANAAELKIRIPAIIPATAALRITMVRSCERGMYERCARLPVEAGSGKSPTENDQLGAHSGSPRTVMTYLGCCCHCCCLLSPNH